MRIFCQTERYSSIFVCHGSSHDAGEIHTFRDRQQERVDRFKYSFLFGQSCRQYSAPDVECDTSNAREYRYGVQANSCARAKMKI